MECSVDQVQHEWALLHLLLLILSYLVLPPALRSQSEQNISVNALS